MFYNNIAKIQVLCKNSEILELMYYGCSQCLVCKDVSHYILYVRDSMNHGPFWNMLLLSKETIEIKKLTQVKGWVSRNHIVLSPSHLCFLCAWANTRSHMHTHTHTLQEPKDLKLTIFLHALVSCPHRPSPCSIPFHCSFLPPFLSLSACLVIARKIFLYHHSFSHSNYQLKITVIIVDKSHINIREYLQQRKGKAIDYKLTLTAQVMHVVMYSSEIKP